MKLSWQRVPQSMGRFRIVILHEAAERKRVISVEGTVERAGWMVRRLERYDGFAVR